MNKYEKQNRLDLIRRYIDENYQGKTEEHVKLKALRMSEEICDAEAAPKFAYFGDKEFTIDLTTKKTFSEKLLSLIDASGMTDAEVYKRAEVSRKVFSKIRTNRDYHPAKQTAIAFAFALGLDLDQTDDLLERAGYALSPCSKEDLVIRYFLENDMHDLFDLNETLTDLKLAPLTA